MTTCQPRPHSQRLDEPRLHRCQPTEPTFVNARLTAPAHRHGLALALSRLKTMARPTGVGRAITAYDMPIEGRDEWLAAARLA